jgi:hypothetical protein
VAPFLLDAGFAVTAMGLQLRVARRMLRLSPDTEAQVPETT